MTTSTPSRTVDPSKLTPAEIAAFAILVLNLLMGAIANLGLLSEKGTRDLMLGSLTIPTPSIVAYLFMVALAATAGVLIYMRRSAGHVVACIFYMFEGTMFVSSITGVKGIAFGISLNGLYFREDGTYAINYLAWMLVVLHAILTVVRFSRNRSRPTTPTTVEMSAS